MAESKPKKELTEAEKYKKWKNFREESCRYYKIAIDMALTMEDTSACSRWSMSYDDAKRIVNRMNLYEEDHLDPEWEDYVNWVNEFKKDKASFGEKENWKETEVKTSREKLIKEELIKDDEPIEGSFLG